MVGYVSFNDSFTLPVCDETSWNWWRPYICQSAKMIVAITLHCFKSHSRNRHKDAFLLFKPGGIILEVIFCFHLQYCTVPYVWKNSAYYLRMKYDTPNI